MLAEAFFYRTQHDVLHRFFVIATGFATQSMISRSQQSCAKVIRSFSPLSQRNSKLSPVALSDRHTSFMCTLTLRISRCALQQKVMSTHNPVHVFCVNNRKRITL